MRFSRFLIVPIMFLLSAQSAFAQSTNIDDCGNGVAAPPLTQERNDDPNRFVGVCHLENTTSTFAYDPSDDYLGELQFSVRSCSTHWGEVCENAIPYTVVISGESDGSSFVLRRDRGNGNQTVEIGMVYSSGGISHEVSPDTEVPMHSGGDGAVPSMFPGGDNGWQRPASITVNLTNPRANLQPGTYSGTFYLSIYQCGSIGGGGWNSICNGQQRYTYLESLPFHIELGLGSTIRISGLEDMALSINPGSGATGSQIFCVESSGGALFRITADSASGSGQFQLQGIDQLEYSARVEHLPSGRSEDLPEGQVSSSTWPGHSDSQCQNLAQENMQITVNVSQAELEQAQSSSYADTLTLTVELE